jgi:hypothetical protein
MQCTEKFYVPWFIPFDSLHWLQISDFSSIRFYKHQNSQYGIRVKCRQYEFLCNGYLYQNSDVILHIKHSDITRIWPAISVHFFIICHTAYLQERTEFKIVHYDIWPFMRMKSYKTLKQYNYWMKTKSSTGW